MIPCVVALDPAPTWPDEVTVEVGDVDYGHALARECGSEDGWRYTDASATAIELCGQACAGARAEGGADAVYHCSDEPPPEPPGCR